MSVSDSRRRVRASQSRKVVPVGTCKKSSGKSATQAWPKITSIPSAGAHEEPIISLLFRISIRLQNSLDRCFSPFGLTSQEAAALLLCGEAGGVSPGQLAKAMGRDKGKITHFVNRLEHAKLLFRKSHTRDRRLVTLHPTARGRRVAPELRSIFEELRENFLAGLLSEEIAGLSSVLSLLYDNIGRLPMPRFMPPYQVSRSDVARPASRKL